MSDLYEEYGLEAEENLDTELNPSSSKQQVVVKKKGGLLGQIVALVLGVVIGVGSCAGAVYALVSSPTKTAIGWVGGLIGLDYETQVKDKLLAEEYGEKTLLEVAAAAASAAKEKKISSLNNIFPVFGNYVESLSNDMKTQFGVELDPQTMMDTPLPELTKYLGDTVKNTPVGNLMEASAGGELDPMLMEICYGQEGVDYTLDENGEVQMAEGKEAVTLTMLSQNPTDAISKVTLASAIKPDPKDTMMMSLAYGKEDVTYVLETDEEGNNVVTMKQLFLTKDENGAFLDHNGDMLKCGSEEAENGFILIEEYKTDENNVPILDADGGNVVTKTYYVKDDGNGNYLAYETTTEEEPAPVYFQKTLIGDLQEGSQSLIDDIYLKDALGINPDSHKVLIGLAYGREGVDYEIVNKEIRPINPSTPRTIGDLRQDGTELINGIALADIIEEDQDDATIMYLLYGKENMHYVIDPTSGEVQMQQKFILVLKGATPAEDKLYNEYGERQREATDYMLLDRANLLYVDSDDNAYTMVETSETVLVDDNGVEKEAAVYNLLDENGDPAKFTAAALGDLSGSDNRLSRLTERMTVGELFGDSANDNFFLKHLQDSTIDTLPDDIGELTFGQMFENDMYLTYEPAEGEPDSYTDGNGNTVNKGDYIDQDDNYTETPVLKGTWKYLLRTTEEDDDNNPDTPYYKTDYKVATDMGLIMDNMTSNIHIATLHSLYEDGLVEFDPDMLHSEIRTTIKVNGETHPITIEGIDNGHPITDYIGNKSSLGELTTAEMVEYLTALLMTMDTLGL